MPSYGYACIPYTPQTSNPIPSELFAPTWFRPLRAQRPLPYGESAEQASPGSPLTPLRPSLRCLAVPPCYDFNLTTVRCKGCVFGQHGVTRHQFHHKRDGRSVRRQPRTRPLRHVPCSYSHATFTCLVPLCPRNRTSTLSACRQMQT